MRNIFFCVFILLSCNQKTLPTEKVVKSLKEKEFVYKSSLKEEVDTIRRLKNLVDVKELNPQIKVEIRYATENNFMHQILYLKIKKAYLQRDVAERLSKCQNYLNSLHQNYSLLIYDAVRPVSIQQKMWDALDSIPPRERGKFVSNPANRSLHNFGAAVDLTICNENGIPLDMGADYDDIRKIAYPSLEAQYLKSGELSQTQLDNRILLRKVMQSQQFRNIPSEWWHFNACSRNEAKLKYQVVLTEED